ncbi:MAG: CNNM domain-containing protein [Mariprofundaceae bacterium]|nr:CNNM domain-containing protein [Mariprofundaceae bacterium]
MTFSEFSLPIILGLLLLLLLLSAFFSGSETALTRARRVRLRILGKNGHRGAKYAEALLDRPERMLASILLGNNFVNIAASSLATALFVVEFGEAGILYATIAMTVIVLIFAEVLPKTLAVAHAESIACKVAILLTWFQRLCTPLVALLMLVIHSMQRIFNVKQHQEVGYNHQELAAMIDLSAESGVLDKAREQMLMSALQLHEVPLKSLMTPRKDIIMLNADDTVQTCVQQALAKPHSRYPIYHGDTDNLLGIIHLRDLLKIQKSTVPLAQALIWKNPPYVPTNRNALAQLFEFQSKHQHMAIVVDEFGDIEGLITLEDIIEEIVGEIEDESDVPTPAEVWSQPDGSWVAGGTANLHDLNQTLESELPENGATTIGGLLVEELGDVPEGKACLNIAGIRIEILKLEGERIRRVRLTRDTEKKNG